MKKCVADIAANFTMNRQLIDYEDRFYNKLAACKREIVAGGTGWRAQIAAWKRKVSAAWDQVRVVDVQRVMIEREAVYVGEVPLRGQLDIAKLRPEDIGGSWSSPSRSWAERRQRHPYDRAPSGRRPRAAR